MCTPKDKLTTMVNSSKIKHYLISQETMLNDAELGWAADIIRNLDFRAEMSDTMKFFKFLREKQLKNHRKVARFAMKCFNDNGTQYCEINKKFKDEIIRIKSFFKLNHDSY